MTQETAEKGGRETDHVTVTGELGAVVKEVVVHLHLQQLQYSLRKISRENPETEPMSARAEEAD